MSAEAPKLYAFVLRGHSYRQGRLKIRECEVRDRNGDDGKDEREVERNV